jgi:uncharacterized protein (DUF1800 family)
MFVLDWTAKAGRIAAIALVVVSSSVPAATTLTRAPDTLLHDSFDLPSAGPSSDNDAARFLAQATFGPTDADITHLRSLAASHAGNGYQAWLTEQFAAAPSLQTTYYNWVANTKHEGTGSQTIREAWLLGALGGPDPQFPTNAAKNHTDQLRQRVAFALSEIFVISDQNTLINQHPDGIATYYDILTNDAFGNFRDLLEDVTLSTQMGIYLNMVSNPRADLTKNRHPDENYAREINQLFTIGLVMLGEDGSVLLDGANKPIPTYSQAVITTFAHVFTGWNWNSCTSGNYLTCGYQTGDFTLPMKSFAAWHDNGTNASNDIVSKQLLKYQGAFNNGLLASGGTPDTDLSFALDNIFHHPNVPPFISKQLIQRLVTSNPSAGYVQRITNIFKNDGLGVRGNLKAVVSAILLDPEARSGQMTAPTTYGKLREPLLRMTHFWRAMGALHHCGKDVTSGSITYHYANQPYRYAGYASAWGTDDATYGSGVGQAVLDADTVFNFFKPSFIPAGVMAAAHLVGPEFQIATDSLIVTSTNSLASKSFNGDVADTCGNDPIGDMALSRALDSALAGSLNGGAADPATKLVNAYNVRFMSGQMSPFMQQTLLNDINPISSASGADWKTQRINRALLLISTSPEYLIQK